MATTLRRAFDDPEKVSFAGLARGWPVELWPFRDPLAYLGKDGGGGIGSGPGISVGAALALHTRGRLTVSVLGDGDFAMGLSAVWTAVRHRIPLLILVNNNRSYFNDELHQETVAARRGREPANRWIGQRLSDPEPDLAKLAEAQGAVGIGPVRRADEVEAAIVKESPCCARAASASSTSMSIREPNATPPPPSASAPRAAELLLFPPFQRTTRRSPGATVNEPLPGVVVMQHRPPNCLTRPLNRLALVDQRNVPRMVVIATGTPRS